MLNSPTPLHAEWASGFNGHGFAVKFFKEVGAVFANKEAPGDHF